MKIERHEKILNIVNERKFITVNDLSEILNVSQMTIRRDLNELDELNKIAKVHGGARGIQNNYKILSTQEKSMKNIDEKKYIGKIINSLIDENSTIYLGAGTTILYALESLDISNQTIVTNNLYAFQYLSQLGIPNLYLTGGEYFEKTGEFFGFHAENIFRTINIDIAFHTTNGLTTNFATTSNAQLAQLQNTVINLAKKNYLLADHTKFDIADAISFAKIIEFDGIVTDDKLPHEIIEKYQKIIKLYY